MCWRTGVDWLGPQTHGFTPLVPNKESLSPEQEMVQDLRSIMHWFSSRLYGLGAYMKKLNEAIGRDVKEGGPRRGKSAKPMCARAPQRGGRDPCDANDDN